jgi:hypothetical protein
MMPSILVPICFVLVAGSEAAAQRPSTRVIDQEPYDLLTLKEGGQQFKLVPLGMAKRRPVTPGGLDAKLLVRLLKRPEQQYQIAWAEIERIELFEQIVLAEAKRLVDRRDYDEAYEYYEYLEKRTPDFPGLADALRSCLFCEADYWRQAGRYGYMLALLNELYDQDSRYPELPQAMGIAVDRLVEEYFAEGKNAAARMLLADLENRYSGHDVVQHRRQQLIDRAQRALDRSRGERENGAMRAAHDSAADALAIWPELPGAGDLLKQLQAEYPIVEVGVRRLPLQPARGFTTDWSARRHQRLTRRTLFELERYSETGEDYHAPYSEWQLKESVLALKIDSTATWGRGERELTSHDVAQGILSAWNAAGDVKVPDVWRSSLLRVDAPDVRTLNLQWRFVPPRWQPLLQIAPACLQEPALGIADYQLAEMNPGTARFVGVPRQGVTKMPREVIEHRFGSTLNAIDALRRCEIQILDRVPPWELPGIRRFDELEIGRYAAPTVHMLLVNPNSELLQQPLFRRGLVHAVNRQQILEQLVGSDAAAAGAVVSGPFPRGYAYDEDVKPRSWDPRLAIALWQQVAGRDENEEPVQLKLVYPPSEIARRAARAIQQQVQLDGLGIRLRMREWTPATDSSQSEWDLRYVEWPAMEPIIDAARLLGNDGMVGLSHASVRSGLRRVVAAETMNEAIAALNELHRIVHADNLIIPLWQLDEYFAHHDSLTGTGTRPVTLYQFVQHWQVELD